MPANVALMGLQNAMTPQTNFKKKLEREGFPTDIDLDDPGDRWNTMYKAGGPLGFPALQQAKAAAESTVPPGVALGPNGMILPQRKL